ncbi:MAG: transcription termination factor Rho [Ignavibacteria bacterium]|nr:transcription termination factor Rho [Ignavibacteria bacterium]
MSIPFSGILEIDSKRFGFVRTVSHGIRLSRMDPYVSSSLIAKYRLRPGVLIEGNAEPKSKKSPEVGTIERINNLSPAAWSKVKEFSHHEVVSPSEMLHLEGPKSNVSMRIVDLFCPVGKGQRALIVSPPKAGKTMLMQQLAHAISVNNPEIDLLVLLIDERPEEVTDMRRSVNGEVFASSSDSERGSHVRLSKLVLEYAKRKVEAGKDVVLLLDSLTRMGRAFNIHQKSSGRTMSGGVDARALEIPKRIFGAARNIENGSSLTIIATALIETSSRMDELIFQEFKGTGNMELVLDRDLANERIFPAIKLNESGTRREELLFGPTLGEHQNLRRSISRMSPRGAMLSVLKLVEQYPTNELLIAKF